MINMKFELIFEIFFLKLCNINLLFSKKTLMWKNYIINEALLTTKQVQIINKKVFIIALFNINSKMFIMHIII